MHTSKNSVSIKSQKKCRSKTTKQRHFVTPLICIELLHTKHLCRFTTNPKKGSQRRHDSNTVFSIARSGGKTQPPYIPFEKRQKGGAEVSVGFCLLFSSSFCQPIIIILTEQRLPVEVPRDRWLRMASHLAADGGVLIFGRRLDSAGVPERDWLWKT